MKVNENESQIKSLGFEQTSTMSVAPKNVHKIFKLLSTSTYKSVKDSVLRELLCNSVDSNVEAGKPNEPVYLIYKNNTISIIDNGIGMSEEFVNTQYMSLGESTKEGKENMIGNFGVGRAVLFAYTDHYNLISRYNDVKYTYLVSQNEEELPEVLLLNSEPTEECNGVEVNFELLHSNDFASFEVAAKRQLKYFRHIIIEGFNIENDFKLIQGKSFLYRPDRTNIDGKLQIAFHNVVYPIDFNYLGISPIYVNCALYFPQETPFQPEVARENLRNTDSNKKLILDKIAEFKLEVTSLWEEQQIVDSFFEYKKKDKKVIQFDEYELDVSNLIEKLYIWKGTVGTNICPKKFKENYNNILDELFWYRHKKSRWSSSIGYLGKDNIYHSINGVKTYKISRVPNYLGVIQKREYEISTDVIRRLYATDVIEIKPLNNGDYIISNPLNIDYEKEIQDLVDLLWSEITLNTKNIDDVIIANSPRSTRGKSNIGKLDVRGKFNTSKWEIKTLDQIRQYKYVVYCFTQDEFDTLCSLRIKGSVRGRNVDKFYLPVFVVEKYRTRMQEFYSYEEFLKTKVVGKMYHKYIKCELMSEFPSLDPLHRWTNVHNMFRSKYTYLYDYFKKPNGGYISYRIIDKLEELHPSNHLVLEYNKHINTLEYLKKYASSGESIKYKLLYKGVKQKLNKIKC